MSIFDTNMKPITLRLKGRATPTLYRMTPTLYRMLLGRTHPRIKRMHAAYGRPRPRTMVSWGRMGA